MQWTLDTAEVSKLGRSHLSSLRVLIDLVRSPDELTAGSYDELQLRQPANILPGPFYQGQDLIHLIYA